MNRNDSQLTEPLAKAIRLNFPDYSRFNGILIDFFNENKRLELLKVYYMLRVMEFRVNFIENDRGLLLVNLDDISRKLRVSMHSTQIEFLLLIREYPKLSKNST